MGNGGCRRFRRLASELEDRGLSESEIEFLDSHREACEECRRYDEQAHQALGMLRGAAFHDVESAPMFEERVIRRFRTQKVREGIRYWSPALVGAVIACVAVFATLAMVSRPDQLKSANLPTGSARLFHESGTFPSLELKSVPRILR
jgi:predicted anti-sigma-YlaC factor YlaD